MSTGKSSREFSVHRPDGVSDCIPVSLFGDEVEAFDGNQYMCINWSSEVSIHHTNAKLSKFFIQASSMERRMSRSSSVYQFWLGRSILCTLVVLPGSNWQWPLRKEIGNSCARHWLRRMAQVLTIYASNVVPRKIWQPPWLISPLMLSGERHSWKRKISGTACQLQKNLNVSAPNWCARISCTRTI